MNLNAQEFVQAFGLAVAIFCVLYSLGTYGSEGDFYDDYERYAAFTVPNFGAGYLFLTATWKMVTIRGEMKRGEEDSEQLRQGESSSEVMLGEASSFWFYGGVLATTLASTLCVAAAVTLDDTYFKLGMVALPIVVLIYIASIFCQPRRNSPKDVWKLRLHMAR
ncbi:hypothetical protein TrLO_g13285 [Triparma laevis f. longispina]|uniref:Uncharacterized protein n=1 Tax=Triparma laevis f. longispina TaxID=1714387 RepID=A0A9W7ALN5_9STRA|nr:hypothetical protein TrLO_g13285 [Triparma laevis f. longispina]